VNGSHTTHSILAPSTGIAVDRKLRPFLNVWRRTLAKIGFGQRKRKMVERAAQIVKRVPHQDRELEWRLADWLDVDRGEAGFGVYLLADSVGVRLHPPTNFLDKGLEVVIGSFQLEDEARRSHGVTSA
jgi:hypothetical protein